MLDLIAALIQTRALRLAPPGQVFWYTSGTVGPYYIDTHYLCGGQARAEELLGFIDAEKGTGSAFPCGSGNGWRRPALSTRSTGG